MDRALWVVPGRRPIQRDESLGERVPMEPVSNESEMTVAELLAGYGRLLAELRKRGVVRSNNAPAGDYAEWLTARALSGELVKNFSVKSNDLTAGSGELVQVKTRVVADPPTRGQLQTSPFRSWDFDLAAFVLLRDRDYFVVRASLVPRDVVKENGRYVAHVNGYIVQMTPSLMGHPTASDITDQLNDAARTAE